MSFSIPIKKEVKIEQNEQDESNESKKVITYNLKFMVRTNYVIKILKNL